jgi:outer membrane protein OmpA-like peptidoglycan-associated protein
LNLGRSGNATVIALGESVKSKVLIALLALVMGPLASATQAGAQSFRLNRFRAAERPDDAFGVRRLGDFGHLRLGALLTGDYAHEPLVIERGQSGGRQLQTVVEHQLTLKLDLSLGVFDRAVVFAGLEALSLARGPDDLLLQVPAADGAGVGDVSLGARVRIWGEADDFFALGAQLALVLPSSSSGTYRGESGIAARPELIAELRPKFARISFNLGTTVREQQRLLDFRAASDLLYGVAVGVPVHRQVELIGELGGAFSYKDFAERATTEVAWLLGGKYVSQHGVYLAASAGTGLTHAIGSPDARVVAQVGYLSRRQAPPRRTEPGPSDRDHDGVLDSVDQCPDAAEDRDGFEDADGCPDPDNDQDGVLDGADACPLQAEDRDGFEDADGCPELDNDQDGVLDTVDACPIVKGTAEERGCPPRVQFTEEGELIILDQIMFDTNQAVILPESFPILEAVRTTLDKRGTAAGLRIEGHTDSVGQDAKNMALSEQRAAAVRSWLTEHGTAASRLLPFGCGEKHPIASDETAQGRAQNRRVVFQLVEPGSSYAHTKAPAGCRPVK